MVSLLEHPQAKQVFIPVALSLLVGESIDLRKGGWVEVTSHKGKIEVTKLVQDVLED